jgi:hypothetical protein
MGGLFIAFEQSLKTLVRIFLDFCVSNNYKPVQNSTKSRKCYKRIAMGPGQMAQKAKSHELC